MIARDYVPLLLLLLLLLLLIIGGTVAADEPLTASDCSVCHEEAVDAFSSGPHGRAIRLRSEDGFESSCVTCHGPGAEHVEELSLEAIDSTPDDSRCLTCHPGSASKMELLVPAHNRYGIRCLDCHDSGHGTVEADYLLKDQPRKLCATCHLEQAATFRLPYAHRDGLEPFNCTDCHSTHSDTRVGRLNLLTEDGACTDCHTGQSRPFVFPHPPLGHGCVDCHTPHGSPNPRMLTRRTVSLLCLECHADVPAFHDVTNSSYRNCQNCHAAIHGSNRDPRLIEE